MIKHLSFMLTLASVAACSKNPPPSEKREISECLADILWNDLAQESLDYDLEMVLKTIRKNSQGKRESSTNPRLQLSKYIERANEQEALNALERAEDFLSNFLSQNGTIVLRPGKVMYKVINPGNGPNIKESTSPLLHFSEKDLDGEILYDTRKSNNPIRLNLDEATLGFKLGIVGMRVGERREIVVHPELAYKKLGKTKPNQLLIYDVAILDE